MKNEIEFTKQKLTMNEMLISFKLVSLTLNTFYQTFHWLKYLIWCEAVHHTSFNILHIPKYYS